MVVAAATGAWGLHAHPVPADDPFLGLIEFQNPGVLRLLIYGYCIGVVSSRQILVRGLLISMPPILVFPRQEG